MTREEALAAIVAARENVWAPSLRDVSLGGLQVMLSWLVDGAVGSGVNPHAVTEIAALCLVLLETTQ